MSTTEGTHEFRTSGKAANPPTWELLDRIRRGDRQAGDVLCQRYGRRVAWIVRRSLRGRLAQKIETEDLVQSSFCELFAHLGGFRYNSEAAFVRWLTTLVENKVKAYVRYHLAHKRDARCEEGANVAAFPSSGSTPSEECSRKEFTERLGKAIGNLPPRYKRIVIQRTILDLPWEAISRAEGISVPAAQMVLARAKRKLEKELTPLKRY